MQKAYGRKPIFGNYDELSLTLTSGIKLFTQNTRKFMETVKVIMKQQGLVLSKLKAEITVAKTPINFILN
jgi:hypothetical protein